MDDIKHREALAAAPSGRVTRGTKKEDLITLLRGERAKEVELFQSKGVNVRSRFQAVHVDDYGADPVAEGLEVKEIMTPDSGLQKVVLVPKDKKRTWDVDLFANQGALLFASMSANTQATHLFLETLSTT